MNIFTYCYEFKGKNLIFSDRELVFMLQSFSDKIIRFVWHLFKWCLITASIMIMSSSYVITEQDNSISSSYHYNTCIWEQSQFIPFYFTSTSEKEIKQLLLRTHPFSRSDVQRSSANNKSIVWQKKGGYGRRSKGKVAMKIVVSGRRGGTARGPRARSILRATTVALVSRPSPTQRKSYGKMRRGEGLQNKLIAQNSRTTSPVSRARRVTPHVWERGKMRHRMLLKRHKGGRPMNNNADCGMMSL